MFEFIAREALDARIDEAYLSEVENRYGVRFPQPLREYYLRHNGAEFEEAPFISNGYRFCVAELLTIRHATMPLEEVLENQEGEDELEGCVPFAMDADYEYYYWLKDTGEIVYIDFEDVENRLPVCGSMEEFFQLLNENAGRTDDEDE